MGGRGNAANRNSGSSTVPEKFEYIQDPELKDWSAAEEKRNADTTKKIYTLLDKGGWNEFYEENLVENVETFTISAEGYKDEEVTVDKMNVVYAQNWDENDKRVKQGKAVTGTTYYTVQDEDGAVNEEHFAYKTKEDALHAAKLYVDRTQKYRDWFSKRSKK